MKKILLDNALESWSVAVEYCRYIKSGLSTLHYKKTFVASLHNAIELFFKQIMLDNNDHKVIDKPNVKNAVNAQLCLNFYNSNDLNEFFLELSCEERNNFHSINFDYFKDNKKVYKKTLDRMGIDSIKGSLQTLQNLRNNETHFFISAKDYLSEEQFVDLHNLMIIVFNIMEDYVLLPAFGSFLNERYRHLIFVEDKLESFSYFDALKESKITQSIIDNLNNKEYGLSFDDPFTFAELYFDNVKNSKFNFNEVLAISTLLSEFNCIVINPVVSNEIQLPDGEYSADVQYYISINI